MPQLLLHLLCLLVELLKRCLRLRQLNDGLLAVSLRSYKLLLEKSRFLLPCGDVVLKVGQALTPFLLNLLGLPSEQGGLPPL